MVKVNHIEVVEGVYYTSDYMWVRVEDGKARIGVTDYAQKQMREIVFVELPSVDDTIELNEPFGTTESVKAISDLVAPLSGVIEEINEEVESRPELLNEDPYGEGWLVVINPTDLEQELKNLMNFEKAVAWYKETIKEE